MKLDFKTFTFSFKEVTEGDKGKVSGYASVFENIDLGLDIVERGSFAKTLQENGGKFPILADHSPSKQIGWNVKANEESVGLWVDGEWDIKEVALARERFSLAKSGLKLGVPVGLSIGYRTIKSEPDRDRPAITRLKELKLYEYSQVVFPMNTAANISGVKNFDLALSIDSEILEFVRDLIDNGKSKDEILLKLKNSVSENEPDKKIVHSIKELGKIFK
jgi:HK97 family phage prohead protease